MATNRVYENGFQLAVVCTHPTTPASGGPVRYGELTGIALVDEGEGGNDAGETTVDFGPSVWNLSVAGVNAGGNSAVAVGDALYYVDADTPVLSKKVAGYFFGYALDAVGSGLTATIRVIHAAHAGRIG